MLTLSIVEDNPDIREGLCRYFETQTGIVCSVVCDSMEEFFISVSKNHPPDVILLDIGLPGMSGLEGITIIKEQFPKTDIIILTVYNDTNKIFEALCTGASGYLLKDTPLDRIKEAVETAHEGGAIMSPKIARKVFEFFGQLPAVPSAAKLPKEDSVLTDREREIVQALVDGLSYKLVAARLGIAIDTVRAHIKRIYGKLHVNSKVEVVSKALKREI